MTLTALTDLGTTISLLALWMAFAQWWAVRWLPESTATVDRSRAAPLDGLRGVLALAVLIHHAAIHRGYWNTGRWIAPESLTLAWLGPAPVALFFMLTGFLFWGKALRGKRPEPMALLLGRVRRIVPLYVASGLVTLSMTFALLGGLSKLPTLIDIAITVLSGGFFEFPFIIDGVRTTPLNAGVTWTLRYEWYFYAALPVLAHWATPRATGILFLSALGFAFVSQKYGVHCLNFAIGMSAAALRESTHPAWKHLTGCRRVSLCLLAGSLLSLGSGEQTGWSSLALGVVFILIARGESLGGLLTSRGARLLGQVSYSIYLTHGIVLYLLFHAVDQYGWSAEWSDAGFAAFVAFAGILTILSSITTYRWIEQPFMHASAQPPGSQPAAA